MNIYSTDGSTYARAREAEKECCSEDAEKGNLLIREGKKSERNTSLFGNFSLRAKKQPGSARSPASTTIS